MSSNLSHETAFSVEKPPLLDSNAFALTKTFALTKMKGGKQKAEDDKTKTKAETRTKTKADYSWRIPILPLP